MPKTSPAPTERRLEYLPLSEVLPALKNPKLHAEALDASLGRFGFTEPVLLDERTGRLVAGHGRLAALKKLHQQGHAAPEGVRIGEPGETEEQGIADAEWLIPVVRGWASKDDREAEAYLLASNRLVESGGWNDLELTEMLTRLQAEASLIGVGFNDADLEALLSKTTPEGQGTDAFKEWEDMPAFENETHVFRKIVINFERQEDVDDFARLIGQDFTEKTRSVWHPYKAQRDMASLRYAEADGVEEEQAEE